MDQKPQAETATPAYHALTADAVLEKLKAGAEGLPETEAARRRAEFGPNLLPSAEAEGPWRIFWRQINNPIGWLLIGAGALALLLGKPTDALVVFGAVGINAVIGFIQEFRAGKAIEALAAMIPTAATVLRGGQAQAVSAVELVPGDVVTLQSGDKIPADLRLLRVKNLLVEEAALTGESLPVAKRAEAVDADASLGDRLGMAYSGTLVVQGTATGVVVAIGGETELGRINALLNQTRQLETPLTRQLAKVSSGITVAVLAVVAVLIGFGIWVKDAPVGEALMVAVSLAVAAIPEGLPAVITICLAIGVRRMADRNAVVRHLPAVETLGSTTVICTDKTGTLTRNEMTVQALWTPQDGTVAVDGVGYEPVGGFTPELPEAGRSLLEAGVLCNDASLQEESGRWTVTGDPTEGALLTAAEKAGLKVSDVRQESPRLDAIPFESENQFMATLHRVGEASVLLLKGAPEVILSRCSEVEAKEVHEQVVGMASRGIRVLAFARKELPQNRAEVDLEDTATGFRFLGLQGMIDPPRSEAIEAIRDCHRAGITVKMITGDHQATAQSIGEQLGLRSEIPVIVGRDLGRMDEAALTDALRRCHVFARVAPEHKLRLVKSLQNQGEVVAMTGDGVNDAPALKQANIGVAMGITGTSVSKQAADLVLTDDNFASIRAAVEEGRRVYDNLIKSLAFVLPTNLGLALILTWGVAFFPFDPRTGELLLPMLPAQLLWVNLIASFFLATPLAFEAPEKDLMDRPPRRPGEPILGPFVLYRTIMVAILMTAGALLMFLDERSGAMAAGLAEAAAVSEAQTMAVTTVVMFQIFYLLNCRSLKHSLLTVGMWSNPVLYLGIAILAVLQALFIYFPPMNAVFDTVPLQAADLGKAALVGATILPVVAVEKAWRNWRART